MILRATVRTERLMTALLRAVEVARSAQIFAPYNNLNWTTNDKSLRFPLEGPSTFGISLEMATLASAALRTCWVNVFHESMVTPK